jgi:hypothetical protein
MVLRDNAIPIVRVTVDPAHEYFSGPVGSFNSPDATEATLSRIIEWHKKFQTWSVQKKPADFHLIVTRKEDPDIPGDGTVEQTLDLKNWVLTGAGIKGASASGNFALEVELSHPLAGCDNSPAVLSGFKQMVEFRPSEAGWADIPTALVEIMRKYATYKRCLTDEGLWGSSATGCPEIEPPEDSIREKLTKQVKAAADIVDKHLKWNAAGYDGSYTEWPVEECFAPMLQELQLCLSDQIIGNADATPYEILMNVICPTWGTILVSTYWADSAGDQKLELRPFSPWMRDQVKIVSTDVADVQMPGVDPAPVAAIIEQHQGVMSAGEFSVYIKHADDNGFISDEIAYMPEKIVNSDEWGGRVYHLMPPTWCMMTGVKEGGKKGDKTNQKTAESDRKLATGANSSVLAPSNIETSTTRIANRLERVRSAIWSHCKYTFMSKFRQGVSTRLSCRLLITSPDSTLPGNHVIPGHVFQLVDAIPDFAVTGSTLPEPIFDFYCDGVVHSMDCQNGHASTEITGKYVRPVGEFDGIVKSGDLNPLYTP